MCLISTEPSVNITFPLTTSVCIYTHDTAPPTLSSSHLLQQSPWVFETSHSKLDSQRLYWSLQLLLYDMFIICYIIISYLLYITPLPSDVHDTNGKWRKLSIGSWVLKVEYWKLSIGSSCIFVLLQKGGVSKLRHLGAKSNLPKSHNNNDIVWCCGYTVSLLTHSLYRGECEQFWYN